MKLRDIQKWPQNSFSFFILGDRALFSFHEFSSFAILDAAKKETLFQRKVVTVSTGKRAAARPGFEYLKKGYVFPYLS